VAAKSDNALLATLRTVLDTLQHDQLMPECGILCFKSALGLEERGNQVQVEKYLRDHRGQR
jgi:hypothetical protein